MYQQSEFGNLETYLLEKKYIKNNSCEETLDVHIFTGTVEFKKHRFKSVSLFLINAFDEKTLEIMSKVFVLLCITIALGTTINYIHWSSVKEFSYLYATDFRAKISLEF